MENVLQLWDIFFADFCVTGNLDLADFTALAMVQFVSKDLMRSDNSGCLRRLLKFPPISDVSLLTKQAMLARDGVPEKPVSRSSSVLPHDVWEDGLLEVIEELAGSSVSSSIQAQIDKLRLLAKCRN